jgi:hypothetical protein
VASAVPTPNIPREGDHGELITSRYLVVSELRRLQTGKPMEARSLSACMTERIGTRTKRRDWDAEESMGASRRIANAWKFSPGGESEWRLEESGENGQLGNPSPLTQIILGTTRHW